MIYDVFVRTLTTNLVETEPTEELQVRIPETFIRFLENRELNKKEKVLEVVLVYNGDDRWQTIINPNGMRNSPSTVIVDYNHNGKHTGAYIDPKTIRVVQNYKTRDGNILSEALIAEMIVPPTAQLYYTDKKTGKKESDGNMAEAIERGELPTVSIRFMPVRQRTNIKTGIVVFETWDLIDVGILDEAPGQPHSTYKILRSLKNSTKFKPNIMPIYKKDDQLSRTVQATVLSDGEIREDKTFYQVDLGGEEREMEENELREMFGEPAEEVTTVSSEEVESLRSMIKDLKSEIETFKTESKEEIRKLEEQIKTETKNNTENKTKSSEPEVSDQDKEDEELARSYKESVAKETTTFEALTSLCRSNKDLLEKIENQSLKSEITRSLEEQKSSETPNSEPAESQFSDESEVFETKVEDYQRDLKSQKYQFTK